ncbi:hypothetical protein DWB84_02465 [Saccharophagus sp. K07]|jgi:hypothetical protein|nr:hypothetical protein [Saccharophagus sp. K07]
MFISLMLSVLILNSQADAQPGALLVSARSNSDANTEFEAEAERPAEHTKAIELAIKETTKNAWSDVERGNVVKGIEWIALVDNRLLMAGSNVFCTFSMTNDGFGGQRY